MAGEGLSAIVEDVSYDAQGCSISQAATSVMTDLIVGRSVKEAIATQGAFTELMQGRVGGLRSVRRGKNMASVNEPAPLTTPVLF